jgi:photosystem II stability/assembly factor-like uncharacterized protein
LSFKLAVGDTLPYLAGNSVIDIEYNPAGSALWAGTGSGVSVSTDFGLTWRTFTTAQGISNNSISALELDDSTVWIGMAHSQDFNGDLFPVGDGFNFSFDLGENWDTAAPDQSTGKNFFSTQAFGMLPYDIASDPTGLWSACFFGGLIRSIDGGQTWVNIFPSVAARTDFLNKAFNSFENRFFSVAADSLGNNTDTIEVYAGSAGGITRFLVIDAKLKLAGTPVWSIHSDNFVSGGRDWMATGGGISRVNRTTGLVELSYFDSTSNLISDVFLSAASPPASSAGAVIMGGFEISGTDTVGQGLARFLESSPAWDSIDASVVPQFFGKDSGAYDLVFTDNALWAAGGRAGLWRSTDFGDTWQKVYVDTSVTSPTALQNRVLSVGYDAFNAQLYVGTADGIYRLTLGGGDAVVAYEPPLYAPSLTDTTGQIIRDITVLRDSGARLLLWAAAHRDSIGSTTQRNVSVFSNDSGANWQPVHMDLIPWDFTLLNDTVYVATNGGLLIVSLSGGNYVKDTVVPVYQFSGGLADTTVLAPGFRSVTVLRNTELWLGGDHGFANREGAGPSPGIFNWNITPFIPRDSVDHITQIAYVGGDTTISGDFVIALDIQRNAGQKTIWASTRPVESPQFLALSSSTDNGRTWTTSLTNAITWNIASFAQHVWAATSDGLYHTTDAGANWTRVPIVDVTNGTQFFDGTEILSVRQVDATTVFGGSEDGFAKSTDLGLTWTITRTFVGVNTEAAGGSDNDVYASPVPYRPGNGRLRIHYKPPQDGSVRIDVFDFAMQKVATILDGVFRAGRPGPDPFGTNHHVEEWDAFNDKGDRVATGVYFFRVEMNGSEPKWGKLVILP